MGNLGRILDPSGREANEPCTSITHNFQIALASSVNSGEAGTAPGEWPNSISCWVRLICPEVDVALHGDSLVVNYRVNRVLTCLPCFCRR